MNEFHYDPEDDDWDDDEDEFVYEPSDPDSVGTRIN